LKFWLLSGLFLACPLHAEGIQLITQWSADTVQVGEPVSLRLSVIAPGGEVPHFPELSVSNPAASLVQTYLEPMAVEYVFTFWDVGQIKLPGIPVRIVTGEDSERTIRTDSLSIIVASALTGQEGDIREIKSMVPIRLTDPWSIWFRAGIIILLAGTVFLIWRTRQRHGSPLAPEEIKLQPGRVAKKGLKALRDLTYQPVDAGEHYLILSHLLRQYLEQRFLFRALEMTTSEIKDFMPAEVVDPETLMIIGQVLEHSDLAKFADVHHSAVQWQQDLELTGRILDRTQPTFRV
jgi:hypothetical protein